MLNFIILFISSASSAGLNFFSQVLYSKVLDSKTLGLYISVLAIFNILSPIVMLGLPSFWIRLFGEGDDKYQGSVKKGLRIISISLLLAMTLIITMVLYSNNNLFVLMMLCFGYLASVVLSEVLISLEQVVKKYRKVAFFQTLPHLTRVVVIIILCLYIDSFSYLELTVVNTIPFLILFIITCFYYKEYSEQKTNYWTIVKKSIPYSLGPLLYIIYYQSDIIMIGSFLGQENVPYYSFPVAIVAFAYMVPSIVYQKIFLSDIHRVYKENKIKARGIYYKGVIIMFVLSIFVTIIFYHISPIILELFFPLYYDNSINYLNYIVFSIPMMFLIHAFGSVLNVKNYVNTKNIIMCIAALSNVIANIILIPMFDVYGAIAATYLSYSYLIISYFYVSRKRVFA
ncbi:polysaccharide biosynthesis C-terminal domain-containing protein [Vibrio coralliirubri]|uniref:oligosaccharide flippase family protein n=1 Tax=Vibrio coralliirubri TaxID=1516159 RepID=UPI00069A8A7B|nr:polysaccharide biosynthesis C-terminal domain-containing protein [Vibrio coralliirubri]